MTDKKKNKKSEEEVLFPEAKFGGFEVKPWSFGILFEISGLLDEVLEKVEEKGLFDMFNSDTISYLSMVKVFTIASPQILKIISITLNEDEEKIKELSMEDGINIAIEITRQNWTILKNVLTPVFLGVQEKIGELPNEEKPS